MTISNISGGGAQFHQNAASSARQEQIQQRMADMKAALQASSSQDQLKSDVVKLLDKMGQSFQSQPGSKLPQIQETMSQFSTFLEHIDPSVFEEQAEEITGHKRKLKQPANTAFLDALKGVASKVPSHAAGPDYPQQLVDEAVQGRMGAITALGIIKNESPSPHGSHGKGDPYQGIPLSTLEELEAEALKGEMGAITALAALKSAYEMTDDASHFQTQFDDNLPGAQSGDPVATQLVVQASVALGVDHGLSDEQVQDAVQEMIPDALLGNMGAITGLDVALASENRVGGHGSSDGSVAVDLPQEEIDRLYAEAEEGRMGAITALGVAKSTVYPETDEHHDCKCAGKVVLTQEEKDAVLKAYYAKALAGDMGAITALSMIDWGATAEEKSADTNPVPKKIRSFAQLMLWFTQELMGVHSGDINAMMKAANGNMFGAVSTEMKVELEALIKQLLTSGHGIDDLEELKQIMALVGILGFDVNQDLLDMVKDAVKAFIEENMASMDVGKFVEFLQMVNAIVGPVLGKPPTDDAMLPELVRSQLDAGVSTTDLGGDQAAQGLDGLSPDGEDVDPTELHQQEDEEDGLETAFETVPVNPQLLQQQTDHVIRSRLGGTQGTVDSVDGTGLSSQVSADTDSGDERGKGGAKDFALSLEESVASGFESVAIQMLDVMNKVIISRIDPSLDQIMEQLDLSGIDLDSFSTT